MLQVLEERFGVESVTLRSDAVSQSLLVDFFAAR